MFARVNPDVRRCWWQSAKVSPLRKRYRRRMWIHTWPYVLSVPHKCKMYVWQHFFALPLNTCRLTAITSTITRFKSTNRSPLLWSKHRQTTKQMRTEMLRDTTRAVAPAAERKREGDEMKEGEGRGAQNEAWGEGKQQVCLRLASRSHTP